MRFWKKLKKDQRGMTLTEIMLGFAILAILMAVSLSIMLFSSRVFSEDGGRDRLKMLGDEMYSSLSGKITFATHIQVLPKGTNPSTTKYKNVIFVKDGRLYMGPKEGPYKEYYSESTYQSTKVMTTVSAQSDTVLSLKLTFTKGAGNTAVYETSSSMRLINLAAGTDSVIIERPAGPQKDAVISYDGEPYQVEETKRPSGGEGPYTVKRYSDSKKILDLTVGVTYSKGDIVSYGGKLWQLIPPTNYFIGEPQYPGYVDLGGGNYLWRCLDEEWGVADSYGNGFPYTYLDVISYKGTYYMNTLPGESLNTYSPMIYGWVPVYWFPEKETEENPRLGWSLTKENYYSIYNLYKPRS